MNKNFSGFSFFLTLEKPKAHYEIFALYYFNFFTFIFLPKG